MRIGEIHPIAGGDFAEIVEYYNNTNCTIKLKNGELIYNIHYWNLILGTTRNPYQPTVAEIGYIGIGKYSLKNHKKFYRAWSNMLTRGYNKEYKIKNTTYKDCSVIEEWHNFQNFAKWFEENYNPETMQGWDFDKDILIKGNKIYSPETCCFIPPEVNRMFAKSKANRGKYPMGVNFYKTRYYASVVNNSINKALGGYDTPEEAFYAFKIEKEKHIKEVADKWRELISEKVYQALINYQVEITD